MDNFKSNQVNINPTYFKIGDSTVLVEDLTLSQIDFLLQKCDRKRQYKREEIEQAKSAIKRLEYQIEVQNTLQDFLIKRKLIFEAAGVTKLEKKTSKPKKNAINAISAVVSTE
jgi:hypothetical protein